VASAVARSGEYANTVHEEWRFCTQLRHPAPVRVAREEVATGCDRPATIAVGNGLSIDAIAGCRRDLHAASAPLFATSVPVRREAEAT
jgi:hypothetical protein